MFLKTLGLILFLLPFIGVTIFIFNGYGIEIILIVCGIILICVGSVIGIAFIDKA